MSIFFDPIKTVDRLFDEISDSINELTSFADIADAAEDFIEVAYEKVSTSDLESLRELNDDLLKRIWCLVDVDTSKYVDRADRMNTTLSTIVFRRLDRYVEFAVERRNRYIANLVLSHYFFSVMI